MHQIRSSPDSGWHRGDSCEGGDDDEEDLKTHEWFSRGIEPEEEVTSFCLHAAVERLCLCLDPLYRLE